MEVCALLNGRWEWGEGSVGNVSAAIRDIYPYMFMIALEEMSLRLYN